MIPPVLDRRFVLEQLERVQRALEEIREGRRGAASANVEVSPEEAVAAMDELEAAKARELSGSSGQKGYALAGEDRRGGEEALIDSGAFISHDPVISNLQSAIEYCAWSRGAALDAAGGGGAPDGVEGSASPDAGSDRGDGDDARRVLGPFSETDPGWIGSLFAMGVRKFRDKRPFNSAAAGPVTIADNARLVLVGDWGSGLPRAQKVSAEMRKVLDQGARAGLDQHVIHLGDVYYSGWEYEYLERFLKHWPVRLEEAASVSSWCLNGNHDMYSGGWAYFDTLLRDPRFAKQQQSSFFSLTNAYWQVFCLDTAHDDAGLKDPQAAWLEKGLKAGKGKGSMLLSHHQLFSVYEPPTGALEEKVQPVLDRVGGVDCWFWGHEHRCVFYREHQGVRNARLIGHGGVPVYMTHGFAEAYEPPAFYEYRSYISKLFGLERFAMFGFAVVDFRKNEARVRYIDENGSLHYEEVIKAEAGGKKRPRGHGARAAGSARPRPPEPEVERRSLDWSEPPMASAGSDRRSAAPRPATESAEADTGSTPPAPTEVVRRTPHMDVSTDEPIQPGERFTVAVYADQSAPAAGERSVPIEIPREASVTEYRLRVWLSAGDVFKAIDNQWIKELVLRVDRPSTDKVVFELRAAGSFADAPEAELCAIFDYNGRSCGSVRRSVPLAGSSASGLGGAGGTRGMGGGGGSGGGGGGRSGAKAPSLPASATLRLEPKARTPDLTIKVHNPSKDFQTFNCTIQTPLLAEFKNGKSVEWKTPSGTPEIVENYFKSLVRKSVGGGQRLDGLIGAGMDLFKAAPEVFKDVLWELLDTGAPLRTISVVSDDPYIPWELMIPWRTNERGKKMPRKRPLGAEFALGRWLDYLLPVQDVRLKDSLVFAPVYVNRPSPLKHAPAEVAKVANTFKSNRRVRPGEYEALRQEMKSGGASVVHFVCHGATNQGSVQRIYVEGTDAYLTSLEIQGMEACAEAFDKTSPLVFLNACEVGVPTAGLNGVGGFARVFIEAGASCVIAPLWSVKDEFAHQVASAFYDGIKAKNPTSFARVIGDVRGRAYDREGQNEGEDTFAAYIFYGDPLAVWKR